MNDNHPLRRIGRDPTAFEAFYRANVEAVQRFIARRVNDPHLAADLTADVFLAVIEASDSYRPSRGTPIAWLYGVARNVVADRHRQRARELRLVTRVAGRALLERVEDRITAEQESRRLYAALSTLPEDDRALIELVALDGLSVADAAQVLGVKPGTARVRLHRARRQITTHPLLTTLEVTS